MLKNTKLYNKYKEQCNRFLIYKGKMHIAQNIGSEIIENLTNLIG